ncbi:metallophosphoesterase [Saccharibacillus qingshengii]|uniref:metallophosphoesterase n=1 Tax=Saccharibacillus qingshengii TaxID=1763540 RepID=UPI001553E04B|nr:metallophosphoesterase [Saccharibacillus qingshengii]
MTGKRTGFGLAAAGAALLLLGIAGCGGGTDFGSVSSETAAARGENMTLAVATDLHALSGRLTDRGEAFETYVRAGDGKQLNYSEELIDAFTEQIAAEHPDVLILSGDLTNNGERKSHEDLAAKLHKVEQAGTSVYVIPGNHDLLNPWARGFEGGRQYRTESVTEQEFVEIYGEYGYDEAASRDKASLSYLVKPSGDLWLLMLDTSKYADNAKLGHPETDGELKASTLKWIADCGRQAEEAGVRIIPVMHHNLTDHSEVVQEGFTLNNAAEAADVFAQFRMTPSLSGHIHIQHIAQTEANGRVLYDIVTGAQSVSPNRYGLLTYDAAAHTLNYEARQTDVEGWAKRTGSTDPNLLHFREYSRGFFAGFGYEMAFKRLIVDETYTSEQVQAMAKTMADVNVSYFAGTQRQDRAAIEASEGYRLWMESEDPFTKRYVQSILGTENEPDPLSLTTEFELPPR